VEVAAPPALMGPHAVSRKSVPRRRRGEKNLKRRSIPV
jgi:hypothetical protein